jgi:hypothetical protein
MTDARIVQLIRENAEHASDDSTLLYLVSSLSCSVYYQDPHRSFSRHNMSSESCYIAQCTCAMVCCRGCSEWRLPPVVPVVGTSERRWFADEMITWYYNVRHVTREVASVTWLSDSSPLLFNIVITSEVDRTVYVPDEEQRSGAGTSTSEGIAVH